MAITGRSFLAFVLTGEATFLDEEPESGVWRKTVCDRCDWCNIPLRLLEGPICDWCIDASEMQSLGDRYAGLRSKRIPTRTNRVVHEHETPVPPCISARPLAVKFEVNLETREITVFNRREKQ